MLVQGIAPIFGEQPCCFISEGVQTTFPEASFGSQLANGFCIGADLQPEGSAPSMLMGTAVTGKTSLIIHYNKDGVKNRIQCDIQDDDGRMLSAQAQLSEYAAKRLFICADMQSNEIRFYEYNIHPSEPVRQTEYHTREHPHTFSNFTYPFMIGGACIDGHSHGSISTKFANFLGWGRPLKEAEVSGLCNASRTDLRRLCGDDVYLVDRNEERRAVFQDDLAKISELLTKDHLTGRETRETASIIYRWLLDRHPMLQDLCNELGIQLTFPGATDKSREMDQMEIYDTVLFYASNAAWKAQFDGFSVGGTPTIC
jgi:hypothetical protein